MQKSIHFFLTLFILITLNACSNRVEDTEQQIVMDEALLLQERPALMDQYLDFNTHLLQDFDIDFRVITTTSDKDINTFSNRRFNILKSRSSSGKTILLVINTVKDSTRVEVSMALEPIYTDAFVSYIERKGMVPYFQDLKVADGVYMMSELIRDRATEAAQGKEFMPAMQSRSIGAGAKTEAKIGQCDPDAKKGITISSSLNDTPADVLAKYFSSLKNHNQNPDLDIFTEETKKFFRSWTVTDINMDNELRFASHCKNGKYYSFDDNYAVLLYPVKPRTCAPYLFKKEDGRWKLDIFTMAKVIRFNKNMMWHFDMQEKASRLTPYEFSFNHFKYDENGFPFYKKRKKQKLRWGYSCKEWYKPGEPENLRCWISWLDPDASAKNGLGLRVYDRVMGIGSDANTLNDPTEKQFMEYMKMIPKGETVTVTVIRNEEITTLTSVAP